ncbi:MAG: NAD(P)/FAD-dependent oxidoreductase [Planctomycetaceae bacterium]
MEHHQVLIVGGGPAGSSCAKRLGRRGVDVLVLDKQTFPRDKTCAGWVTPPVFDALGIDPADYPADNVLQSITGFRTGLLGGREVQTQYDKVVSYGIRRCEFDHFLLQRCGAPTRLGEPLKSLERDGNGWIANGEIHADLVVGAGGHFCPVARRLGNRKQPQASVVAAQEIEFEVSPEKLDQGSIAGETPELFFCRDLQGYGWCFRKGNYLNIGLGRVDRDRLSEHVADFCRFLRLSGKVACEIPQKLHGHAYQLYERINPTLCDDGVLLIGDAAGLSYPQSGEGIRPAVESALMAADVIHAADGRYTKDRLADYAARIVQRFGKPRSTAIADHLPHGMLRFLATRLMASRWFARRVVLDRWFLHATDPPLPEPRRNPE